MDLYSLLLIFYMNILCTESFVSILICMLIVYIPESVQSDTNAPFNQRLSSSTPDPEKALYHVDHGNSFQTVPERDNSGPVTKETVSGIMTIGNPAIDIPASSSGVHLPFSYYDTATNTGSGIQFGNHGNTDGFYTREIINTSSSGFIPTVNKYSDADIHGWMRRDSDIQTYQSYLYTERINRFCNRRQNSKRWEWF